MVRYKLVVVVFLFFGNLLQAQEKGITLKVKNVSLDEVFEKVEQVSDYTFLYSDEQIEEAGKQSLTVKHSDIRTIMELCLKKSNLTYRLMGKTIVLIPKKQKSSGINVDSLEQKYVVVEGRVKDEQGKSLEGVNIFVKNYPGVGVISGAGGHFKTKVRKADVLVFSYVGFKNREVFVGEYRRGEEIVLQEEHARMEEVQVVGYGVQRKVSVTGAISTMRLEDRNFPVTSFSNMLAGNVAGIIGVQRSGEPGRDVSEFWIRGISTFGANDKALILIDGVERTTFNDLIPEDIASFSVLKDASATAVYGAKGANGVVLIETKRGKAGRMKIRANVRMMLSGLSRLPDYLPAYEYAQLANEAKAVREEPVVYSPVEMEIIKYGLDRDLYPDVNWQKEILKKCAFGASAHISMSGGGEIGRYYVSLNYKTNDAAYRESGLNRYHTNVLRKQYSFRANLDVNMTPSTVVTLNLATILVNQNRPGIGMTDSIWAAQATLTPLLLPVRYSTGHLPAYANGSKISPAVLLNETGFVSDYQNEVESKLSVEQNLAVVCPGLSVSATVAFDVANRHLGKREKMPELYKATGRDREGRLILTSVVPERKIAYSSSYEAKRRVYLEARLTYERNREEHRWGGMSVFNLSQYASTEAKDEISSIPHRSMGWAGRATYSYRDIYLAELNLGYNGTENFPRGQRFHLFPSVSVGWIPTGYRKVREFFPWLHFFKWRYSVGSVGNDQISNSRFPYLTYVSSGVPGYAFGDQGENIKGGIAETVVGTDFLVWEKALKQDVGIDLNIAGKFQLEWDYFRTVRDHIFMQRTDLPAIVGIPNMPYGNVGKMSNQGFDATLYYRDRIGKVDFECRGNITYTRDKILEYDEAQQGYEYQRRRGKGVNQMWGYVALGYFRDSLDILDSPVHPDAVRPGDLKYKDINGDGEITEKDKVVIGNSSVPRLQYGIAGSIKWKNWEFSLFFRGAGLVNYFYGGAGYFPFSDGSSGNILSVVGRRENRWIPAWYSGDADTENPKARFPRLSYGKNGNNFLPSTHWLADGSYFRLKTLELAYTFPAVFLRKLRVESLRISLLGDNLHVWDKVRDWDPEQASSNGAVYPLTRSVVFNFRLHF